MTVSYDDSVGYEEGNGDGKVDGNSEGMALAVGWEDEVGAPVGRGEGGIVGVEDILGEMLTAGVGTLNGDDVGSLDVDDCGARDGELKGEPVVDNDGGTVKFGEIIMDGDVVRLVEVVFVPSDVTPTPNMENGLPPDCAFALANMVT